MLQPPQDPWLQAFGYALLAGIGGFLGYLMRMVDNSKDVVVTHAILEAFSAGFVGLLVLFTCQVFGIPPTLTGVLVGISGWLGASASIRVLEVIVYDKLGIRRIVERSRSKDKK